MFKKAKNLFNSWFSLPLKKQIFFKNSIRIFIVTSLNLRKKGLITIVFSRENIGISKNKSVIILSRDNRDEIISIIPSYKSYVR